MPIYFLNTSSINIDGNITAGGYISGLATGVYAYLSASADTTITTALTYYPIVGTFTNAISENFVAATVNTPGIKYSGTLTQIFEIDWHATVAADANTTTVTFALFKNGVLIPGSQMAQLCKIANELFNLSGTTAVELAQNDEIQLVLTSDGDGDVITVSYYTTTICEFFD